MPKVKGPLFSISAHGTMKGAITFQGSPSGPRVQKVPRHRDMYTGGQSLVRTSFLQAVSEWRALDGASKEWYNESAEGRGMTGYNLYIKNYLTGSGGEPPPPPSYTEITLYSVGGTGVCRYWIYDATDDFATGEYLNAGTLYWEDHQRYLEGGVRFVNVSVPQGKTIAKATLSLIPHMARSAVVVNTKLGCEAEDDPDVFSDKANYKLRHENADLWVEWNAIGAWALDGEYRDSPDIKTCIQSIVDRGGWASGQAVVLFWRDNGSTLGEVLTNRYGKADGTYKAKLYIKYQD